MTRKKRIERLEARKPVHDPALDALVWQALASMPFPEEQCHALIEHARAVAAGTQVGDPPAALLPGWVGFDA